MNPVWLPFLGPITSSVLGVLGFLAVRAVFQRLDDIAADVKEIRGKVDQHAERLAKVEAKAEILERRLERHEDRRGVA